jgi:hypothetical protein
MKTVERFQAEYDALKANIISDIWFYIKDRDGKALEVIETKGIPALVTGNFDDQFSETIDELIVKKNKVFAVASSIYDDVNEYDIETFEIPFLIAIYDSVVKHIELEESK